MRDTEYGRIMAENDGEYLDGEHLDENAIAGFLDGDLEATERDRAVLHLDQCARCRTELQSIRVLADTLPASVARQVVPPRRSGRWVALGGILAASLATTLVLRRSDVRPPPAHLVRARVAAEGIASIDVVSPARTASGGVRPIVFMWRSAAVDMYRFTLMGESGDVVFTTETTDTSTVWPRDVPAKAGAAYFWRVDGVDGSVVSSTGAQRLRFSP